MRLKNVSEKKSNKTIPINIDEYCLRESANQIYGTMKNGNAQNYPGADWVNDFPLLFSFENYTACKWRKFPWKRKRQRLSDRPATGSKLYWTYYQLKPFVRITNKVTLKMVVKESEAPLLLSHK